MNTSCQSNHQNTKSQNGDSSATFYLQKRQGSTLRDENTNQIPDRLQTEALFKYKYRGGFTVSRLLVKSRIRDQRFAGIRKCLSLLMTDCKRLASEVKHLCGARQIKIAHSSKTIVQFMYLLMLLYIFIFSSIAWTNVHNAMLSLSPHNKKVVGLIPMASSGYCWFCL